MTALHGDGAPHTSLFAVNPRACAVRHATDGAKGDRQHGSSYQIYKIYIPYTSHTSHTHAHSTQGTASGALREATLREAALREVALREAALHRAALLEAALCAPGCAT